MGRPRIPEEEAERIRAAMREGKSCNAIAKEFGRSTHTVSRIARECGHKFAQMNTERAREIRKGYTAEWRAKAMRKWMKAHDMVHERLYAPTLVYNFGGRDNDYNEHELDKPDAKTIRDLMQAGHVAMRTIDAIHKADQETTTGKPEALLAFFGALQAELGTEPPDDGTSEHEAKAVDSLE